MSPRLFLMFSAHANGALQSDGSGQLNATFLIAGGVLAGIGVMLWAVNKGGRWAAPVAAAAGAIVLSLGFVVSPGGGGSDAVVSIVEPSNGDRVDAGQPVLVRVAVRNGPIATSATDQSGGHLHLYVDGALQQMPYSSQTEVTLGPGRHSLRVEYVDNRHVSFDPPIAATVTVNAVTTAVGAVPE